MSKLRIFPISLKEANIYIETYHRHHKKVQGHRFSLAAKINESVVGVVCVGRPVARMTDHKTVCEVTRLCTNGEKNVCSKLYAASARVCKEMGYLYIQTFILDSESGVSLKASGWIASHVTSGGSWSRDSRARIDKHPISKKIKYVKVLNEP